MKPNLKIIRATHRPVDIYADWRAKIEATDWARVHIWGDRNPPLDIADRPKRSWR